jgi:hypothetical protein
VLLALLPSSWSNRAPLCNRHGRAVLGVASKERSSPSQEIPQRCDARSTTKKGSITLAPGIRTKDGEKVLVTITRDGHYMLRCPDGRVTFI